MIRSPKAGYGILIIVIAAAVAVLIYSYLDRHPKPFLDHKSILFEINSKFGSGKATEITDVIILKDRFAYVPFRTIDGDTGNSFWEWKKVRWNLIQIQTTGDPVLWSLDGRDPAKMYLVYYMNPLDEIEEIKFYNVRNRRAYRIGGVDFYLPRIQIESSVSLRANAHGTRTLPKEWPQVMQEDMRYKRRKLQLWLNQIIPSNEIGYVGWIPYNHKGEEIFPRSSIYGSRYSISGSAISNLLLLDEEELEWLP